MDQFLRLVHFRRLRGTPLPGLVDCGCYGLASERPHSLAGPWDERPGCLRNFGGSWDPARLHSSQWLRNSAAIPVSASPCLAGPGFIPVADLVNPLCGILLSPRLVALSAPHLPETLGSLRNLPGVWPQGAF